MFKGKYVTIEYNQSTEKTYIIKDSAGITIGRISLVEFIKENKFCSFRLSFYRHGEEYYEVLKDAVESFLKYIFSNKEINKLNFIAGENILFSSIVDSGFQLEGVLFNSVCSNGNVENEYIFGIDRLTYENEFVINILRLQGERISLKVLSPGDSKDILDYYIRNKEHLRAFEPSRPEAFYTLEFQKKNIIECYKQFLNGTGINFGIYNDNRFIGKIQISNIVYGVFKNAFIGYSIDYNEQNKGYMKEAVGLVMDYAFKNMELHRLEATTLIDNEKSQRVLKASGFKEIGISKNYLMIDGEWRDHKIFYKTKD